MVAFVRIGNRRVGHGQPIYLVADIGLNHCGSAQSACNLVDISVQAGFNAVCCSFISGDALWKSGPVTGVAADDRHCLQLTQQHTLSVDDVQRVHQHVRAASLDLLTYITRPEDVTQFGTLVDGFVVPQGQIDNQPLLQALAQQKLPFLLHVGGRSMEQLAPLVESLESSQARFLLIHHGVHYPARFSDLHVHQLRKLRQFGVPVGYTSNELGIAVATATVLLGADVIMRMVTEHRDNEGPYHANALEKRGMELLVRDVRKIEQASIKKE